ncbi:MAG: ABC transporter substrate-binding protein [Chloroflexi bacterium]|nr:ABC transporter substrate-binding protein [Chloroflexota bacterium]
MRNTLAYINSSTALTLLAVILAMTLLFLASSNPPTASAQQPQTTPSAYGESPDLAAKVAAGELPPVWERLPSEPMVIPTLEDGIGKYGGTLRRFYLGPADGCNFFRLSRASLVRYSQDGFSLIPSVARWWEVSDDGREWTFFLREGMKWSDGDDFTADDFVYQYEDVILNEELNPNPPFFLKIGAEVGSIHKVDDTTVMFKFPVPNFLFLEIVAQADEACYGSTKNVPWAPSHYMKQFHAKYNPDARANAEAAEFESWTQYYDFKTQYNLNPEKPTIAPWKYANPLGDRVVRAERNPYFWAVDPAGNQLPYLDDIQLTLVDGIELGTLMAVQGDVDMQGRHIQLDQYTILKQGEADSDYEVLTWPAFAGSDVAFFFNMSLPGPTGDAIRTKEFRQALSLAIDRSAIQEIQFLGLGEIRQSVPPPGHPHYPGDDIARLRTEYDPDAANALLDSVFPDKDREGFRLNDGERIVMSITVTDAFGTWPDAAQVVGRAWEAVGVKADVNVTTRSQHFTRWQTNEWAVMVWNEFTSGFTFSSINLRAPEGIGNFHAPGCGLWLIDANDEYAYPCLQESIDLLEMHRRGPSLPEAERNALGKGIYRTIVENQYNIGIVGLSPMVQGVIVKKNNLNNVPDTAANDWPLRTPNTGFPEQWYFENGVPPARSAPTPDDQCVEQLPDDGVVNGKWADDCASENRSPNHYSRYYTLTLSEQAEVTITLESSADTYLYLLAGADRDGRVSHENDDHATLVNTEACADASCLEQYDSCITASLGAGDHTIEATTFDPNTEGTFELTVIFSGTVAPPPRPTPPSTLEAAVCNEDDIANANLSGFLLVDANSFRSADPGYWGVIGWHSTSWINGVVAAIACGAIQYDSIENARWNSLNYSTAMQQLGSNFEVLDHEQVFPSYIGDDMLAFRYRYEVESDSDALEFTATEVRFLNADSIIVSSVTYYLLDTHDYAPIDDVEAIADSVADRIGIGSAQSSNRAAELFGFID